MKINDILVEDGQADKYVQQFQKKKIERELRQLAGKLKGALQSVSIQFAGHFADRMIDSRNDPMISLDELENFIKKIDNSDEMQQNLAKAGKDGLQAVVHELKSKINIPFMIQLLPDGPDANTIPDLKLVPKTIMRKANFGTSGPKFQMEHINAPLFRKAMNLVESGNAVEGVGPIAREELLPTLKAVEKELGINLSDVTLGSAAKNRAGGIGKKAFSGDIDATVNIQPGEDESFKEKLDRSSLIISHVKHGNTISTKVKIVDYDPNRENPNGTIPDGRTGYVQLDFMPGDFDWNSFYFHSPEEGTSQYKGGYRTVMLATIASIHDVVPVGDETTDDGRPVQVERWKFSPTEGLVRIRRTLKKRKDGNGYTKAFTDEIIGEPIRDGERVMQALDLGGRDTADSFETLWSAVQANYPDHEVEDIKQAFLRTSNVAKDGAPKELQ